MLFSTLLSITAVVVSVFLLLLCLATPTREVVLRAGLAVSLADVSLLITGLTGMVALISSIEGLNYISTKKCFI
jgi:hypothetical protein